VLTGTPDVIGLWIAEICSGKSSVAVSLHPWQLLPSTLLSSECGGNLREQLMDESSRLLILRRLNAVVPRSSCAREGAAFRPVKYFVARPPTQRTPHDFNPAVASDFNPVIPNPSLNSSQTMGAMAIDWQEVTATVRSADCDQAIRTARAVTFRTHIRWRRSRDLEWVYGHQHARDCTRKDRRPRFYDKDGRQPFREWARRRTQHQHARKSAALRERMRIMRTFFIQLPIDAPGRNPHLAAIAA
jgi:hypothetical protein